MTHHTHVNHGQDAFAQRLHEKITRALEGRPPARQERRLQQTLDVMTCAGVHSALRLLLSPY